MTSAVHKKMMKKKAAPSRSKLLVVLLLFSACAVVALLVRDRGVQVARMIPVSLRDGHADAPPPLPPPSDDHQEESEPPAMEIPYAADTRWEIQWESISRSLSSSSSIATSVGLLNFNSSEVARWRTTLPAAHIRAVRLAPAADDITWEALYPEWIDEDNPIGNSCPSLPDPDPNPPLHDYELVAVKLPCRGQSWSRDVRRLHLQLSAAKLAHHSGSSSMVLILSESECLPLPNLFPCKHLLARHAHAWLYRPDAAYLRHRLSLPIGSCQLAVPFLRPSGPTVPKTGRRRQAYATVLHSADAYVCGAIALAQSIRQSGSTRDLVALVDAHGHGADKRAALVAAGWQVRPAPRIRNPRAVRHAYNEWNYSKFRLWQLTDYDRVVFLDADLLVLRNMDFLFEEEAAAELSATANSGARFNSGVMVLEPCNCTFELLMSGIHDIDSYNGGDQGYLNEVFTWWHRLPRRANLLKYVWDEGDRAAQARLLSAEPAEVYAVHYLGRKPWLCYRDYDCNWNVPALRRFASDEAHARWWAMHDRIEPAELRHRFCALPERQMAALEQDRREAERAMAPDAHWNRTITDPRAHRAVSHPEAPL
ncbi:UDP-glucuronate:xylan alpha-glucuronosyltransferase 1-like [Phragmites australis]|uniref:UDP-glucuronate:xylan alpha-glucuronosyltransferase 1-like n=1 Tax=Phragmites australis TaxID=29695 RepID=UPI002D7873D0|nr:UDP-glucuronate:xylan alpha-glucuronosyltransferase 1-like [Phragmites australis]